MTRNEALETVDAVDYFGMDTNHKVEMSKKFINNIYDEFEAMTCENCKHYSDIGSCNNQESFMYDKLSFDDFGCNKWEAK